MKPDKQILAFQFAFWAHNGQKRDYTGEPYINHPVRVALDVATALGGASDSDVIAAALLHDVVEDTGVTLDDIVTAFGPSVGAMVDDLTKPARPEGTSEADYQAMVVAKLRRASAEAQTIKLCDIADNARNLGKQDPRRAQAYLPIKRAQAAAMVKGDATTQLVALQTIDRAMMDAEGDDNAKPV